MLLSYKPLHSEAQQRLQEEGCIVDINKDYEFSVDPDIITLVESDPFHGYESETIVAHLTKLNDIATLFT